LAQQLQVDMRVAYYLVPFQHNMQQVMLGVTLLIDMLSFFYLILVLLKQNMINFMKSKIALLGLMKPSI
jgi:hypothetical protein